MSRAMLSNLIIFPGPHLTRSLGFLFLIKEWDLFKIERAKIAMNKLHFNSTLVFIT